jgi:hypothetical protein
MKKLYLILFVIAGAAVGIYGVFTMQLLLAAGLLAIIVLAAGLVNLYPRLRSHGAAGNRDDEVSAIIAGAAVAGICVMIHAEYFLWAIALAALFLIQLSLSRIEKRLEKLEKP